jgi:pyruvate kinase
MKILLDDGRIELVVENVTEDTAQTRVLRGGMLLEEKGVNVPEALWSLSSLTEKDLQDLSFIMNENYHAIALSFVRSKENIEEARKYMQTTFNKTLPIITKIETRQALHNLETIIESSDVVMVARGDLGVEIGLEHVPMHQKRICEVASRYNKPVIVATQLLESMVESPTPTRAEVSDVVNAILDGASYIMLSDETTTGKYPIEAVSTLSTIIKDYNATV